MAASQETESSERPVASRVGWRAELPAARMLAAVRQAEPQELSALESSGPATTLVRHRREPQTAR